jgi:hypothetical protein
MEHAPYFHLTFRPNIKLVSTVRRFIAEFFRRILADQELSSRLALATHELLENAVAYSADHETSVRIEVANNALNVKTWNVSSPERIAALRETIDEMNNAKDRDQHYQDMLQRASRRTDGSGLGLARIRAEAEMTLSYEIDTTKVCIVATAPIMGGLQQ